MRASSAPPRAPRPAIGQQGQGQAVRPAGDPGGEPRRRAEGPERRHQRRESPARRQRPASRRPRPSGSPSAAAGALPAGVGGRSAMRAAQVAGTRCCSSGRACRRPRASGSRLARRCRSRSAPPARRLPCGIRPCRPRHRRPRHPASCAGRFGIRQQEARVIGARACRAPPAPRAPRPRPRRSRAGRAPPGPRPAPAPAARRGGGGARRRPATGGSDWRGTGPAGRRGGGARGPRPAAAAFQLLQPVVDVALQLLDSCWAWVRFWNSASSSRPRSRRVSSSSVATRSSSAPTSSPCGAPALPPRGTGATAAPPPRRTWSSSCRSCRIWFCR